MGLWRRWSRICWLDAAHGFISKGVCKCVLLYLNATSITSFHLRSNKGPVKPILIGPNSDKSSANKVRETKNSYGLLSLAELLLFNTKKLIHPWRTMLPSQENLNIVSGFAHFYYNLSKSNQKNNGSWSFGPINRRDRSSSQEQQECQTLLQ